MELLNMNKRERDRKSLLEWYKAGRTTLVKVAAQMHVGYRQVKRIWERYKEKGDKGLVHGNRGKPSNRATEIALKQAVLKRYEERYLGFGPTFASEKLSEDGYVVNHETLRKWLVEARLWHKHRNRHDAHQYREPKKCFGELLQIDGSIHHWFGEDEPLYCLMNLVDDSTSHSEVIMDTGETTKAALQLLYRWIIKFGIPQAIYVDLKNLYVGSPHKLTIEDELNDVHKAWSVFGEVCEKLGIQVIKAYSPQAKGRVERKHAVYQDRLVKEIKLNGITSVDAVNVFLENGFVDNINKKFAKLPASSVDGHRPIPSHMNLEDVFCWEEDRLLGNDWTIRYNNKFYQIEKANIFSLRPKKKIIVRTHLDDSISLIYKNQKLSWHLISKSDKELNRLEEKKNKITNKAISHQPTKNKSPWRLFSPDWLKSQNKPKSHHDALH